MCAPQEKLIIQRETILLSASALSPRHRFVIAARFTGWTLAEVGKALGVSKEQARQIECQGLRKMRTRAKRYGIKKLSDIGE